MSERIIEAVTNIVEYVENISGSVVDGDTKRTPKRVHRFYDEFFFHPETLDDIFKILPDSVKEQEIQVNDIPFFSMCEHHMLPFFGTMSISYVPNGKILGLSKFARLVKFFAGRLQLQERLTDDVCRSIYERLDPKMVKVKCKAQHTCMLMRGVKSLGSFTITKKEL